ncbi:LysR family transcriptional regulator [Agaribacterium haliotis]|uniref:LysR family transcriptional regulator n=1 Tax=Agaribacterium haliotis TaxID=2013869 RepID=UPI000BB54F35|nr:LysR family transcriptional regulator [Agaribacterium haliotis]
MNTELLRTFLEVAKTRHFGHAAENLFLTQSAVSSRIKLLEEALGVPLFTRKRNNILLTPAGERLLSHAENMLATWQLAVQEVGVPSKKNMQLALGGTSNLWDTFLQALLPQLAQRFPKLYMRTEINKPQHLIRSLLGGRLDVFTVLDAPSSLDIEARKIGELQLIMVSNSRGVRLQDVPALGQVFVDWGTAFNFQQARLFPEPVAPVLHTGQSHIALEFILNHRGAAFLPKTMVEQHLLDRRLFQVEDVIQSNQAVHLVYAKGADKSPALGPVIHFIENLSLAATRR